MTFYESLLKPGKSKNKAALQGVRDGRMASRKGPEEGKNFAAEHCNLAILSPCVN